MENNLITIDTFNADIQSSLPTIAFDKNVWIQRVAEMPLEDLTPGFIKQIKDAAIAIDKRLSAPIKTWRAEVDEIIACIDTRRAALVKAQQEAEELRKAQKQSEVVKLIQEVSIDCGLSDKYRTQLTITDKYLNKTESINKIRDDLLARIEQLKILQENERLAEESRIEKIKNRELLIENLNAKYGYAFNYSQFDILVFSDQEVVDYYSNLFAKKLAKEKAELAAKEKSIIQLNPKSVEFLEPEVKSSIVSRTVKITGASLESVDNLLKAIEAKGYTIEVIS